MHLYDVTVSFIIRATASSTSTTGSLVVKRYANSAASAISTVSSLYGALSNFAWATGTNAGLKYLEVTEVTATEITS